MAARLGMDLGSTKSKRPVSTQFHDTTSDENIKIKQLVFDNPVGSGNNYQNEDTENKENDS